MSSDADRPTDMHAEPMRAQRHREIMADFGCDALHGAELDALLREACAHTAEGLGVEHAKVLEYRPASDDFLVRAGVGWAEGVVGRAVLPADMSSPPGRAFRTGEAVFIEDFGNAPGFKHSDLLSSHGVKALVNVPIRTSDFTFGILEADSDAPRRFNEDDRNFLTGFANLLAAAVQRQRMDTEREQLVKELARAKEAAEAEAKSKSRLLAATGHDLKQPLQSIVMCLDRLAPLISDASGRRDISRAVRSAEKLARELDRLLAVARIESGTLEPRVGTIELGRFLKELAEDYRAFAEEKGLSLRVVTTGLHIRSDQDLLGHIVQNLLSNAVKYTEEGRILVGCRRRGGDIASIEIHDTGIGIPADDIDAIFEEFRRIDTNHGNGLGLGLSIAKRLADLLGHRMAVRSRPGKGSCFAVEVPIARQSIAS